MPRYAIKIEYNGGAYHGWQRQPDQTSIQQCIEDALAILDPTAGSIVAAGRTDAGVHGLGQVAHFDMAKEWDTFALMGALNFHLKPNPIAIVECVPVADDFHARYTAKERHYLFRVLARRPPITHLRGFVWQVNFPLDIDAMREGAKHLIGHHDFTTFRSTMCQADSPMRTLDEIRIEEHVLPYGSEFHFHVRARSFLHNQVRSLVGTIERVGSGRWAPERVGEALAACDRTACGPVAPSDGLYFQHVVYDPDPFAVSGD